MALAHPTAAVGRGNSVIQSARNGLLVSIPTDARGVVARFFTKGDNELVFTQQQGVKPKVSAAPVKLDASDSQSEAAVLPPRKKSKLEDLA